MKKVLLFFVLFLSFVFCFSQSPIQIRRERIQSSYMLALGRAPSESEITYWQGRADAKTISDFVANHKTYIGQDAGTRRAVIIKAYNDALGRNPTAAEIDYWSKYNQTYVELMKAHVQWLAGNPAEYEKVISRSYQFELGRQPAAAEIAYWKTQGVLSYLILVGCHEDWKRRNNNNGSAPKTSGASTIASGSSLVIQVPISATVAQEAHVLSGLLSTNGGNVIAAGGGNVIAAGGGNVIAAGGGNVIAAGGGN